MGHRRGRRPDEGHVPEPDHVRRPLPRRPRHAAVPAARRPGRPAACSTSTGATTQVRGPRRVRAVRRRLAGAHASGRSAGWRTSRSTRPRQLLLCSGYWWATRRRGRAGASAFLDDVRTACDGGRRRGRRVDAAARPTTRPIRRCEQVDPAAWPHDPLGSPAATSIERAADAGPRRRRRPTGRRSTTKRSTRWAYEVDLLLAERARAVPGPGDTSGRARAGAAVGVAPGRAAPRSRRRWPGGCAARCRAAPTRTPAAAPRSTAGWSSASAPTSCSTSTSCPAPATTTRPPTTRSPRCRSGSWPASGPTARRSRSRCRSRRRSPAW